MQVVLQTMIQWGDCDEQGIVFYPRYFYWMDCAFHGLLRNIGLNQRALRSKFGLLGTPLVKATATFVAPASYDQRLVVKADVARWGGGSFEVAYRGLSDDVTIFEGNEVRVWLVPGHDKPHAAPIPEEFRFALGSAARDAAALEV
ncbi:MAG: acyl-CoA thioesterase [Candidatus Sulfotelmatobacter sp.]